MEACPSTLGFKLEYVLAGCTESMTEELLVTLNIMETKNKREISVCDQEHFNWYRLRHYMQFVPALYCMPFPITVWKTILTLNPQALHCRV